MLSCISAATPIPVSRTATTTLAPSRSAETWTLPPEGVYRQALFKRFENTCESRTLSPST